MPDLPGEFAESLLHELEAGTITFTEAIQAAAAVAGVDPPSRQHCAALIVAAKAEIEGDAPPLLVDPNKPLGPVLDTVDEDILAALAVVQARG